MREVLEVLDEESPIGGLTIIVVVEKGTSMVAGELCKVWITCGYSFLIVTTQGSLWSMSYCI